MEEKRKPRNRTDRTNRTNRTDRTDRTRPARLIPAHGGYRQLKSYQTAEIIYDATVAFCDRFIDRRSRTHDQMVQAARRFVVCPSGHHRKRLTASLQASQASATSKKTELKLTDVARSSLEELLQDYQDFLRQRRLPLWPKTHPQAQVVRNLAYKSDRSYSSYRSYVEEGPPEVAANTLLCLVHQANYLLDHPVCSVPVRASEETPYGVTTSGFTERLYRTRRQHREPPSHRSYQSHRSYRSNASHPSDRPEDPGRGSR